MKPMACSMALFLAACGATDASQANRMSADAPTASVQSPMSANVVQPAAAESGTTASPSLPQDVVAFREKRDQCDHFRGEEATDDTRAAFLADAMERTCSGTDAALAGLKSRYAHDPAIMAVLSEYEDGIE